MKNASEKRDWNLFEVPPDKSSQQGLIGSVLFEPFEDRVGITSVDLTRKQGIEKNGCTSTSLKVGKSTPWLKAHVSSCLSVPPSVENSGNVINEATLGEKLIAWEAENLEMLVLVFLV